MSSYITPGISLLIALGIFFGYMYPTYTGNVATTKAEIATYESALVAAKNYLAKQNDISDEQGKISEENMDRLKAFLPDGIDNVQLTLDLNALTKRAGIMDATINVRTEKGTASIAPQQNNTPSTVAVARSAGRIALKDRGPVDSIDLNISFSATYDKIVSFLATIEQSLRPLDITLLSIKEAKEGNVYPVTMTIRVYWLP
jgi:hypothetical protein